MGEGRGSGGKVWRRGEVRGEGGEGGGREDEAWWLEGEGAGRWGGLGAMRRQKEVHGEGGEDGGGR